MTRLRTFFLACLAAFVGACDNPLSPTVVKTKAAEAAHGEIPISEDFDHEVGARSWTASGCSGSYFDLVTAPVFSAPYALRFIPNSSPGACGDIQRRFSNQIKGSGTRVRFKLNLEDFRSQFPTSTATRRSFTVYVTFGNDRLELKAGDPFMTFGFSTYPSQPLTPTTGWPTGWGEVVCEISSDWKYFRWQLSGHAVTAFQAVNSIFTPYNPTDQSLGLMGYFYGSSYSAFIDDIQYETYP